jgi:tripartite-type tricarboxylate transporter receptor subunit TctC
LPLPQKPAKIGLAASPGGRGRNRHPDDEIMITRRRVLTSLAAGSLGLNAVRLGYAQHYPHKLIRLILPYTAGSPNDVLARLVVPSLSSRLGQTIIIDNRPGGGTTIGLKAVMAADPDGYTLLYTNTPTHVIAQLISKTFTYDPIRDFVPVATFGSSTLVLVVPPAVPVNSLQEFIAYAKANPGKLNFGFGQGTLPHLVGETFKLATGTQITSIPYRGGAQAVADMLGGQIHMNLGATATLVPLIRDGRVKALAVTSATRHPDLPEVPTMAESGLPDVTSVTFYGIFGPAGTPADAVERLNRDVNETLKDPELRAAMSKVGFEPKSGTPQDFATLIAEQMRQWTPLVKASGFQIE